MTECLFCRIAHKQVDAVIVHEDSDVLAFLDIEPIRTGHMQVIPKQHFSTFEELPADLAGRIVALGQQLARRMKAVYAVERVAFLFTGGDIPHAHAHVVPMHTRTDITSARYVVHPSDPSFASAHLRADWSTLLRVREELAFVPSPSAAVPSAAPAMLGRPAPCRPD